jgi:outer membrane biosynthesis protein TonB
MRGRGKIAPLSTQVPEPEVVAEVAPTPEPVPAPVPEKVAEAVPVPVPEPEKVAEPEPAPEPKPDLPDPASLTTASPKADVIAVAESLGISDIDNHSKKELLALIRAAIKG